MTKWEWPIKTFSPNLFLSSTLLPFYRKNTKKVSSYFPKTLLLKQNANILLRVWFFFQWMSSTLLLFYSSNKRPQNYHNSKNYSNHIVFMTSKDSKREGCFCGRKPDFRSWTDKGVFPWEFSYWIRGLEVIVGTEDRLRRS